MNAKNTVSVTLLATLVIAILAGCATSGDLKQSRPEFTIASQKEAKLVAGCVSDKLSDITSGVVSAMASVNTRVASNGYVVQYDVSRGMFGKSVLYLLDIKDVSGGGAEVSGFFTSWDMTSSAILSIRNLVESCVK